MNGLAGVLEAARLRLARRAALKIFLDYDGTLTDVAPHPKEARLPERARVLLRNLAAEARCRVAVISGRRLAEVRSLVGLPSVAYAGNHGFEIAWPGGKWTHPGAVAARPGLESVLARLDLTNCPGAWVEDKGLTLSVHYRQAPEAALPELTARVAGLVGGIPALELRGGKMSLEVRPHLAWDKGQAVLKLAGLLAPEADWGLLYAGDDATDEDAFRVVGGSERGVAILVGERGDTFADFCLPDPEALRELLEALLRERPWR